MGCKTANAAALQQYNNQLAFREVAENAATERFERGLRRLHRQAEADQARIERAEARHEDAKQRDADRVQKFNAKGDVTKVPFYKDQDRLDRQRKFRQEQARQQQDRMLKDLAAKRKIESAPCKSVPCPSKQGKNVCGILVDDDVSTVASSV